MYCNINRAKSTDRDKLTAKQWFRRSHFVTKWGFGQDGSGDSKNIFRIALLSQSTLFAVSLLRSVVVDPHKLLQNISITNAMLRQQILQNNFKKFGTEISKRWNPIFDVKIKNLDLRETGSLGLRLTSNKFLISILVINPFLSLSTI